MLTYFGYYCAASYFAVACMEFGAWSATPIGKEIRSWREALTFFILAPIALPAAIFSALILGYAKF